MSKDNRKSPADVQKNAATTGKRAAVTRNETGRVTHDDRGNAIWEWAVNVGATAVDTPDSRLKKLDNAALSLADDTPPSGVDGVQVNPLGTVKGYSPYDSGLLAKKQVSKKKDLRKLSEWMKLKKQFAGRKPDGT